MTTHGHARGPYAEPRLVTDLGDCLFYHTMDLPGRGTVEGLFDLRPGVREYLGGVDFRGRRVLEIGTANGFLCFHMERAGAEVVAYDLSEEQAWDFVPFVGAGTHERQRVHAENTRKLNNAFWLAHRLYGSRARAVYGTVYDVPAAIGPVDVATFCCVLLHVRDPFLALARTLPLARHEVIVTELVPGWLRLVCRLWSPAALRHAVLGWPAVPRALAPLSSPHPAFLPDPDRGEPFETWWGLGPRVVRRFLAVLGFTQTALTFHFQLYEGRPVPMYTLVAQRTAG